MKRVTPTAFPDAPLVTHPETLGAAARAARTQSGLTLADAALSLGVAKQTLQNLEQGKPSVSLGLALHILSGLGVSLLVVPAQRRAQASQAVKQVLNDAT